MIDMPKSESVSLLENARVGRLAMVGADGRPYTIPLRFVYFRDCIYMRIAHFGRKADALAHDSHVCFESDAFTDDFSDYASVVVEGAVADVTELEEKEEALFRFHEKYGRLCGIGVPPRPVTTTGVALRKLVVERLSGRRKEPEETPAVTTAAAPVGTTLAPKPRRKRALRTARRVRAR